MKFKTIIITMVSAVVLAMPVQAEFIFLKNGSIIEGKITTDSADSITLRDKENKERKIPRNSIMRVLYTSLKMGKIYIQKRDGEGIVAFMVDEDRDSYTFRKDLYKPVEFKLERSEVLFIAEKNPSGLKGVAETDRVSLTWLPPYDSVKHYNVYYSSGKNEKYKLADSVWGKSYTLSKLVSNKTYYIIVTSVDSDGYESSPSNELKINTKNYPPEKPEIISMKNNTSGGNDFKWNEASDSDGKVEKYRLYGVLNKQKEVISEIKKTEYSSKKEINYDRIAVVAVDNGGDESGYSDFYRKSLDITIRPIGASSLGKMKDLFSYGFGASLDLSACGYLFNGSLVSINTGYIKWIGTGDSIDKMNMIPSVLSLGYKYYIKDDLSISALLGAGAVYMNTSFTNAAFETVTKSTVESMYTLRILLNYDLTESFYISGGGSYYSIYEESGMKSFAAVQISIGYRIF